ncbi:MAG TPA: outer membrane lipoprotein carrier protein LolA [Paludibacteraceae bacterium]|nr:outer membrane lipoprotein carrier protein LolA [Paludibacteraceae bacterium]
MKQLFFSLTALIISINSLFAQKSADAEKIINDLFYLFTNNAISSNFKLTISEKNNINSQTYNGSFFLKGNKFMIDMNEMKVWYDGKTQWAYSQQNNEVTITEPTAEELINTNPITFLSAYKNKFSAQFCKKSYSELYCIEMFPKAKNESILKVELKVNRTTGDPVSLEINEKNGSTSLLTLINFKKNIKINDDFFVFQPSKYNDVYINDLR